MPAEIMVLNLTAATVAFFHVLMGPDHYVPFIVMAKARRWSSAKTLWITLACGIGHVGSSVGLGLLGAALGLAVTKLEGIETVRGHWAGWGILAFGLLYMIYGVRCAYKNRPHTHRHVHSDGSIHAHEHAHREEHAHVHEHGALTNYVPWTLFVLFVFGPCEPLIPLVMYPAARHSLYGLLSVTIVFSAVTLATMLAAVLLPVFGLSRFSFGRFERYGHAFAGTAIFLCGCAVQFLGW